MHDGIYCMDGIVTPNREVTTKLLEFKNVMRPARCYMVDDKLVIENMMDFVNLQDYIQIDYQISKNGDVLSNGTIFNIDIMPHCTKSYDLYGECITLFFKAKHSSHFINKGDILGYDQVRTEKMPKQHYNKVANIDITEGKRYINVKVKNTQYVFDKIKCVFTSIRSNKNEILCAPMEYNIWRAPTDNDNGVIQQWLRAGYNRAFVKVYNCYVQNNEIIAKFAIVSNANRPILEVTAKYYFDDNGALCCALNCKRNKNMIYLPRFGIIMFLDYSMQNVEYLGYGPYESYIDKRQSSYFGKFKDSCDNMFTDYIIPQENGSRYGVESLTIFNDIQKICFNADREFCFNISHYTQEELYNKKHNFELCKSEYSILCFDYLNSGIGSGSCCTELASKYQLNNEEFEFNFRIKVCD